MRLSDSVGFADPTSLATRHMDSNNDCRIAVLAAAIFDSRSLERMSALCPEDLLYCLEIGHRPSRFSAVEMVPCPPTSPDDIPAHAAPVPLTVADHPSLPTLLSQIRVLHAQWPVDDFCAASSSSSSLTSLV